jgi:hypothetical protein
MPASSNGIRVFVRGLSAFCVHFFIAICNLFIHFGQWRQARLLPHRPERRRLDDLGVATERRLSDDVFLDLTE